jgi:hypothetical protein
MRKFAIGQHVTWLRTSAGYRFGEPIAARVIGITAKRVRIEVLYRSRLQQRVRRQVTVTPDKLRQRTSPCPELDA